MTNQNLHPDDQSWNVFRYVAGEMSQSEETQFEQLLEHDQELREQVANTVCTMAEVDKAHAPVKVSIPDRNRAAKLRVRRIVVSVAALVLFSTLAITLMPKPAVSESNAESVAVAWAESVDANEFELPELDDDFEFASLSFDGDDDWIVDALTTTGDETLIN